MEAFHLGLFWSKEHPKGGLHFVRQLTDEEYGDLKNAESYLRNFTNMPAFVVQAESYRSVMEAIEGVSRQRHGIGPVAATSRRSMSEIGSRIAIWLEAGRMLEQQTRTFLIHTFGRHSPEQDRWERLVEQLDRSERGYRILSRVRNYSHFKPVPVEISVSAKIVDEAVKSAVSIELSKPALLEDRQIRKWVKENPTALDGDLDLADLVLSMQGAIEDLKVLALRSQFSRVRSASDSIRTLAEEAFSNGDPRHSWPIVGRIQGSPEGSDFRVEDISFLPLDLLGYVPDNDDIRLLRTPGTRGDEPVGRQAIQMRRSYHSWSTRVAFQGPQGPVQGEAHLWSNRIGPGWGGTVILDGWAQPGWIHLSTSEGYEVRAALDGVMYRGGNELSVVVGTLIGHGPAPRDTQVTHPYR